MDRTLLDLARRRTPRYTSYPTAAQFSDAVGPDTAARWLTDLPDGPLSLYLHVPFCRQVCWYCACNMKLAARPEPVEAYAEDLMAEVDLVAGYLTGTRRVAHLHWGGGTPTSMPGAALARVMARVRAQFDVAPDAEIAFELDPRTFTPDMAPMLAGLGCTRVSLGVQEFDPKVQAAVNRIQPFESVARTVSDLRAAGIGKISFDLMYGLPHQTTERLSETIGQAVSLAPDRIALFGYAHVPWMAKRQRMLPEDALPGAEARFEQAETAARLLVEAGYARIGLDHFARPVDPLAQAAEAHRLVRNFQGYSDDPGCALIGLGATAISDLPQGYAQNIAETGAWARAVRAGQLSVHRGVALGAEDRLRRAVISDLMCHLEADIAAILDRHGRPQDALDACIDACRDYEGEGLAKIDGRRVTVTERGRSAMRLIAAAFDSYLAEAAAAPRHAPAI